MNSLRSNSISYFVAQIASRNQRLNIDSKNLHSSKDLFVRNVFERLAKRHGARSAVTALPLGLSKNVFEELRDDKTCSAKCGNREALATNGTQVLGYAASLVEECF